MTQKLHLLSKPFEQEIRAKLKKYHLGLRIGMFLCIIPFFPYVNSTFEGICYVIILNAIYFSIFHFIDKKEEKIQKEKVNERSVGFIQLSDDTLSIYFKDEKSIIKKGTDIFLRFDYFGHRGETAGSFIYVKNTQYSEESFGTNNYLTIDTNSDEKIYIYLNDKEDSKIYNQIIMWCYKNGIQISEFCGGEKTYGGKKLKYKEIQEFKEKYYKK